MESLFGRLMVAFVVLAVVMVTIEAAPAPEVKSKKSTHDKEDQLTLLRQLLAKLMAENEKSAEESSQQQPLPEETPALPNHRHRHQHQEEIQQPQPQPQLQQQPQQHEGEQKHHHHIQQQKQPQQQEEEGGESPVAQEAGSREHQARALSAEDMHEAEEDPVEELRTLDQGSNRQILARVLSELTKRIKEDAEKEEVVEGKEDKEEEEEDNSAGDDMGTSANKEAPPAPAHMRRPHHQVQPIQSLDKTHLIEALISEALTQFDKENGEAPTVPPLFHVNDVEQEEDEDEEQKELRQKALRIIESRLSQDITLANQLGVSVDTLIRDLEEKAYMEAKLKRIEAMLDLQDD